MWMENMDVQPDEKPRQYHADMRGRKVLITDEHADPRGVIIPKGDAYIFNGNTGTIPTDYLPLIFGEGNVSTFRLVKRDYISGL